MNKTSFNKSQNSDDDLLPEYNFDYQKAKANRSEKKRLKVVVLDEDVAEFFTTAESVNKALRELIETMPQAKKSEKFNITLFQLCWSDYQ
ncbi:MAG TPA: hypothetical protein V6D28_30080 [Leptolyngbyaceae cyanobacterium]